MPDSKNNTGVLVNLNEEQTIALDSLRHQSSFGPPSP